MRLPPDPRSPARARGFVTATLAEWDVPGVDHDAALLVNELATNALLHTRAPAELVLQAGTDELRVEVHDRSAALPRRRRYSGTSTTGRGLWLLDAIASAWGVERTGGGKQVWFTLPLTPGTSPDNGVLAFDYDAIEAL